MLQNATPLRKYQEISALTFEHLWWTCLLYRACHAKCICTDPLQINVPHLPSFLEMLQIPHVLLTFDKVHNPLRLRRETTSERPKVLRTRFFWHFWLGNVLRATTACTFSTCQLPKSCLRMVCLCILTWKCASRHNDVHFFDISTSKSAPNLVCCVLCTFWLRHVLRATTACNFSSLIWPAGSAPAALASLLFDPPPQIVGKTQCFATFLPFRAPGSSFFWLFLLSDLLFSSLLFSDSSHLCFSLCLYCRKFDF